MLSLGLDILIPGRPEHIKALVILGRIGHHSFECGRTPIRLPELFGNDKSVGEYTLSTLLWSEYL